MTERPESDGAARATGFAAAFALPRLLETLGQAVIATDLGGSSDIGTRPRSSCTDGAPRRPSDGTSSTSRFPRCPRRWRLT